MKKLIPSGGVMPVTLVTDVFCTYCEEFKNAMMPYASNNNGVVYAICLDCCRNGAKLLVTYQPIPGQVKSTRGSVNNGPQLTYTSGFAQAFPPSGSSLGKTSP